MTTPAWIAIVRASLGGVICSDFRAPVSTDLSLMLMAPATRHTGLMRPETNKHRSGRSCVVCLWLTTLRPGIVYVCFLCIRAGFGSALGVFNLHAGRGGG